MAAGAPDARAPRWWRRVAWLLAIWAASVAAMGLVAWLLKGVMRSVGLSS